MSAHEEYQSLLTDEEHVTDSEWCDQFDEKVVNWLKEAELNNGGSKSRMSFKLGSSTKSSKTGSSTRKSKSENCRGSKVRMEERAIEENIRLAEVITKSIYADQKLKMEYNRKLEMEEKVAKTKSRAKILGTLGDIPLQKYQKEGPLLTEEDNSKNKRALLLRKDLIFVEIKNKIEDQKFSNQSTLNYDSFLLRNIFLKICHQVATIN